MIISQPPLLTPFFVLIQSLIVVISICRMKNLLVMVINAFVAPVMRLTRVSMSAAVVDQSTLPLSTLVLVMLHLQLV